MDTETGDVVGSMTPDGLDAEGYIENCCSADKISPVFRPVLDGSVALLMATFKAKLHSIYVYGSVATGHARPGQSDIDVLAIFGDPILDPDQAEIQSAAKSLSTSYQSAVREVGLGAVSMQEAIAEETLPGLGCFIKHLCVCVAGKDIRPLLPKFRPSVEVARGLNGDFATVIQARLNELAETNQTELAQILMRRICRKTVRTGFSLVMPRLRCWTTDLERSFEYFCRYYPEKRISMALILDWIQRPPEDKAEFLRTVTPLADWLTTEFDRVICN